MQTKKWSLIEAITNNVVAFIISVLVWHSIAPLFGIESSIDQSVSIVLVFTFISIIRSYLLRRFFNWLHTRK